MRITVVGCGFSFWTICIASVLETWGPHCLSHSHVCMQCYHSFTHTIYFLITAPPQFKHHLEVNNNFFVLNIMPMYSHICNGAVDSVIFAFQVKRQAVS